MVNHTTTECVLDEAIPTVNGKVNFPFGLWLRASVHSRNSSFSNNKGLFFSPANQNSSWRTDKGKEKMVLVPLTGNELERDRKEEYTSNTVPINPPKQTQVAAEMMGSRKEEVTSMGMASMPVEIVMHPQEKETDFLMVKGTEKTAIYCKNLVEGTCVSRDLRGENKSDFPCGKRKLESEDISLLSAIKKARILDSIIEVDGKVDVRSQVTREFAIGSAVIVTSVPVSLAVDEASEALLSAGRSLSTRCSQ
ncbi:hypothetical protein QYF36_024294 [Acer negundo]|nr:hypothetical protein QYF36_024294 [Acer negundo]